MSKLLHWKKCLACLLAFALCAALLCVGAGASAQSAFSLGDGTEDNPYQIQTVDQLKAVAYDLDAHYILVADLDLNGESSPWTPIGSFSPYAPFTGTFDGGGHTISGLYIDGNSSNRGLFGYVGSGGTVKNLNVSGSVTGGYNVGGVVGNNSGGTVESCGSLCSVDGYDFVGGVVGCNNSGTVTGCFNAWNVSATGDYSFAGGVVGDNMSGGTVSYCYNTGTVGGSNSVGGVVGYNHDSYVSCCYNAGYVTSNASHTGGVVGHNISGVISSCYNTGVVINTVDNNNVGGVLGSSDHGTVTGCYNIGPLVVADGNSRVGSILGNNYDSEIDSCYFLVGTADRGVGGNGGTGGTTPFEKNQFSTSTKFTGWDFGGTWVMSNGFAGGGSFTRPVLLYNCESNGVISSGDGTADDPYKIPNLATLKDYRDEINGADKEIYGSACYLLIANMDLGGESDTSWEPIGLHTGPFNGSFDGGNHIISGLYINKHETHMGLFGSIDPECTVENLTVSGSVTGHDYIGGIAGESSGTISNCTSNCSVSGENYVGGIAGSSNHTISGCKNYGSVSSSDRGAYAGGIAGSNNSTISGCANYGAVTGEGANSNVGGVAGLNIGSVSNCYNTASVSGGAANSIGGVAGFNSGSVSNCYNTASVSGGAAISIGGVAGLNIGSVSNCYNTASVSGGAANSIGGVAGVNSGSVSNCYSSEADSGVAGSGGGSVSNCYYLAESEADTIGGTTFKTGEQFASGEVAWLLQSEQAGAVWGQDIGEDASPLLTAQNRVYRVLFMNGGTEHAARYCNSGGTVSLPDAPDAPSGQAFDGWFYGDTEFTEATVISSDMTLTARFSNILVSSIRLSSASLTLQVGSTHTLTATVEPEGAANRGITWSSSDTSVATVGDNGLVTAAGVGTATITAAAQDGSGVSAECTVTVTPLPTYTVTVNDSYAVQSGAGSYVEGASVTVSAGERSGYRFAGWTAEGVDLADAGAATVTFNMPAHGVTLTAGWDYINVPDPTYKPIVDVPEGVEVTTDPARPEPGDTVTVTTDPAGSISVTDKDGNPVEVTRNPDGSWSFTQPEGAVTITFTPDSGLPFTDVADGDWYYDAVSYVYANGLMDGVSGTTFEPNANMTRVMVWAILARVDGETVTGANWVETAREWAMANGVSDGENADGYVTREQLATMLWRYAGEPASDYSLSAFTDADSVSDYAATAMAWAVEHGIITGVTDTTLVPQGTATRAQCAAMLMRFVENVK